MRNKLKSAPGTIDVPQPNITYEEHIRPKLAVSVTEAKSRFGSMLAWADKSNNEIVIRVYGKSKGVVMSYGEYKKVKELRE